MTKNEIEHEKIKYAQRVSELEYFLHAAKDAIHLEGTDCDNGTIRRYYTGMYGDYITVVGNLKKLVNTRFVKYRIDNVVYSRAEFDNIIRSKKIELKEAQRLYSKYDNLLKDSVALEKINNADRIKALKEEILSKNLELQSLKTELHMLEKSL